MGGEDLVVTGADIEMGAATALELATTIVDGAMKHMAGSEFEENCKTVLRRIDEAIGIRSFKVAETKSGVSIDQWQAALTPQQPPLAT